MSNITWCLYELLIDTMIEVIGNGNLDAPLYKTIPFEILTPMNI